MNTIQRLLRSGPQSLQNARFYWDHPKKSGKYKGEDRRWPTEADDRVPHVKHHGFNYYPRPNEEPTDPTYAPAKLFVVQRVAKLLGNPKFDKKILEELGLVGRMSDVAIVKNTPQMNAKLYQIKHLIKIKPLVFPNGEPNADDVNFIGATVLNEYGEMKVHKSLRDSSNKPVPTPEPVNGHLPLPPTAKELGLPSDETMRIHSKSQYLLGLDKRGYL